ncbi:SDR family oxidoreductase [Onishia taeanensis]
MNNARVIYITGGAQGVGRGMALGLMSRGYRVVIADHDREAGEACLEELCKEVPRQAVPGASEALSFQQVDVTDEDQVKASLEATLAQYGRLDGVINNAALADPFLGPIESLTLETWHKVLDTNLTGAFLTTKHAARALRERRGSIINIASSRALQSEPDTEAYAASKGGIVALTHALAMSLGPAIRVNAISPGWIEVSEWQKPSRRQAAELSAGDHAQHPAGRVGEPQDIASMAAFLLSDEAGFITGQNFVVDGGMTRKMIYAD